MNPILPVEPIVIKHPKGKTPEHKFWPINDTHITDREMAVLRLLILGHANKQVAAELGISIKTVEKHRGAIYVALKVSTAIAAARFAIRSGLFPLEEWLASNLGENTNHGPSVVSGHKPQAISRLQLGVG